jgi:dTDP-4-dehydrorhamnose reductase
VNVLVLGASGMIGHMVFRVLSEREDWKVVGTTHRESIRHPSMEKMLERVLPGIDLLSSDSLTNLFLKAKPDVVVNCAGMTKHLPECTDPLKALPINSLLPHRLANLCQLTKARLIHISTDCVFSGSKGGYIESDTPDATDVYGKSKELGEIRTKDVVTLRTSTIGPELNSHHGLLEWFLCQDACKGYRKAIFSGLPSLELARVIRDVVIPNQSLGGLYHVGADPIDKNTLLHLIAEQYRKRVKISPDDIVSIDRSLNTELFNGETGYLASSWPILIEMMHDFEFERGR